MGFWSSLSGLRRFFGLKDKYVELFIAKSKTDIYRSGNVVLLAKTGHITFPYNLLNRYIQAAGIDFSSSLMFFRSLHFVKSNASYTLGAQASHIPVFGK